MKDLPKSKHGEESGGCPDRHCNYGFLRPTALLFLRAVVSLSVCKTHALAMFVNKSDSSYLMMMLDLVFQPSQSSLLLRLSSCEPARNTDPASSWLPHTHSLLHSSCSFSCGTPPIHMHCLGYCTGTGWYCSPCCVRDSCSPDFREVRRYIDCRQTCCSSRRSLCGLVVAFSGARGSWAP